jgi:hypothetical protein
MATSRNLYLDQKQRRAHSYFCSSTDEDEEHADIEDDKSISDHGDSVVAAVDDDDESSAITAGGSCCKLAQLENERLRGEINRLEEEKCQLEQQLLGTGCTSAEGILAEFPILKNSALKQNAISLLVMTVSTQFLPCFYCRSINIGDVNELAENWLLLFGPSGTVSPKHSVD